MDGNPIREFYFGDSGEQFIPPMDGSLRCRMRCHEWSDGRLACQCNRAQQPGFNELRAAYIGLGDETDDAQRVQLLLEIIHTFNDEYQRNPVANKEIPVEERAFFTKSIIEVLARGRKMLPASIRAELYREAGMFEYCTGFRPSSSHATDEAEIIAEVQHRALHGDTKPFIIEHCDYYKNNERRVKRFPCPVTGYK